MNKKKWIKVIEFAVVGLATGLISYSEISDFSLPVPHQTDRVYQRSRRSEAADQQRQFLLFSLKLCFQILVALQKDTLTPPRDRKDDRRNQA
jgi:hypothetical protein